MSVTHVYTSNLATSITIFQYYKNGNYLVIHKPGVTIPSVVL
jgi:hypothetical protein